jgi:hypothetical protein
LAEVSRTALGRSEPDTNRWLNSYQCRTDQRVKLLHAAAFALALGVCATVGLAAPAPPGPVGEAIEWYLITPPYTFRDGHVQVDFAAPLRDWNRKPFSKRWDCEVAREKDLHTNIVDRLGRAVLQAARCIDIRDPALNPK